MSALDHLEAYDRRMGTDVSRRLALQAAKLHTSIRKRLERQDCQG